MKVKIAKTKLHGICEGTGKQYLINHESKDGKDMTSLAEIASKSYWFDVDNPQFKPNTIQNAKLLNSGRIEILK